MNEGVVTLLATGDLNDPLKIMIENTESGDDVMFTIKGREYFGSLHSTTTERGFVVASYPDPEISDSSAEVIVVSAQGDEFEHSLRLSSQMRQVYYRAYAVNAEGVAYGSTRYLAIDAVLQYFQ